MKMENESVSGVSWYFLLYCNMHAKLTVLLLLCFIHNSTMVWQAQL